MSLQESVTNNPEEKQEATAAPEEKMLPDVNPSHDQYSVYSSNERTVHLSLLSAC